MQPSDLNKQAANYNVLAPGPVNLHPDVQKALALPMIHHRTPEFDAILKRVLNGLKKVFGTKQNCFLLSSTGSGGMEALLVNVLSPGDRVLAIDSGKFGERWAEMAKTYQAQVLVHKVPWGQAVNPADIEMLLQREKGIKLVLCQACETSTGVLHPIRELGALITKYNDTLFLVDGITALGALPLPMDEWKIDGLVGGSQKAFMLPTGLSLLSFSEKALRVVNSAQSPRFYFDIRKEIKANSNGETFFSSNVTLIRALDVVLRLMEGQGDSLYQEIAKRAQFTREYAPRMGFSKYTESPSPSLTALRVPDGIDSSQLRTKLEEKHRITIMGGQDQAKGKIIRIGHMGHITQEQMLQLMLALADTLRELGHDPKIDDVHFARSMKEFWETE